jgi:hypothetical protein
MAIRSRYTAKQRHTPPKARTAKPTVKPSFVDSKVKPAFAKTKQALDSFGRYVQKNQEAHRRAGISPLDKDIEGFVKNACNRSGEFGQEHSRDIRSRCRRDSDEQLFRDIQGTRSQPRRQMEFEISGSSSGRNESHESHQTTPPKRRKQQEKVVERIVYIPYPPKEWR